MILKDDAPAPEKIGFRLWPRAIPQFNIGHLDTVDRAKTALAESGWEGLQLGGNYVCGVALGKCVEYADEYAENITSYLTQEVHSQSAVNMAVLSTLTGFDYAWQPHVYPYG